MLGKPTAVLATANGRFRLAPLALAVAGALGCAGAAEARITRTTVATHESPTEWVGAIAGKRNRVSSECLLSHVLPPSLSSRSSSFFSVYRP
jgi:hypothetical protein